jgi:hypothetical protein
MKNFDDLDKTEQLHYITAAILRQQYTNNDILTKKVTPEFLVEEFSSVIEIEIEEREEMIHNLKAVLYTLLVEIPEKPKNKK